MKYNLVFIVIFLSLIANAQNNNSKFDLNFGLDNSISINKDFSRNEIIPASIKFNFYFTVKRKFIFSELLFTYDNIIVNKIENRFNNIGVLVGFYGDLNRNAFILAIGGYYKLNSKNNIPSLQGDKIGLTGTVKIKLYLGKGISTAVFSRVFIDVTSFNNPIKQKLVNQMALGFSLDYSLNELINIFKKQKKVY